MGKFNAALLQMKIVNDKEKNIDEAVKLIEKVANEGADIAILPEMFCCPYNNYYFKAFAEEVGGIAYKRIQEAAKENKIYVVAGTIPELENNLIFNTAYVFNRDGLQVAKHRKMHLFDIDVKGGQYFKESDTFTPGSNVTVFETEFGKIGIEICFDVRFPELSRLTAEEGAQVIIIPGAFNMTTGPAHWELLFRSRALDNQVYTIGVAPARDLQSSYHSYGNSLVVSPWGNVLNSMDEQEGYIIQEIDLNYVQKVREEIPVLKNRRKDIYTLKMN
jgi:predicted amidohydrolase